MKALTLMLISGRGSAISSAQEWKSSDMCACPVPHNQTCVMVKIIELWPEITNNVVYTTTKGSDQPAHTRSLIRAFASRLNIL